MAKSSANHTAREISQLRKRRALARTLFFGSIAFMPLSCLGGCGLAMLIKQETVQAVFGILGLLGPFVGLGGLLLMWSDRSRYGRSLDLALQAEEWGLAYSEQAPERKHDLLRDFQVFHDPTSDVARN